MKKIFITLTLAAALVLTGCNQKKTTPKASDSSSTNTSETKTTESSAEKPKGTVTDFKSDKVNYQITIPKNWSKIDPTVLVEEDGSFALENKDQSAYYLTVYKEIEDKDVFEVFQAMVLENFSENAKDIKSEDITVGGMKGKRYTFTMTPSGTKLSYIFDILEGKKQYLQSYAWSVDSEMSKNKDAMLAILNSLTEK